MSANPTNYVLDDLFTTYSSPGVHTPGQCVEVDGAEYRFVRCGTTSAGVAGYPAVKLNATQWIAQYDVSAGIDEGVFVGICLTAVGTTEYHWVKIRGAYHTCTFAGAIAVGEEVIVSGDGAFTARADGDLERSAGVALEASTAGGATGASLWVEGI
jgi:hypothetical protein